VTLGGKIDTQMGHREQKDRFNHIDSNPSNARLHDFAIVNNTRIKVKADGKSDAGLKYGAHIELYADSSTNSDGRTGFGDKVWGYVETNLGRVEAGSVKSAAHQMRYHAGEIASATGGIDGDARDWVAKKTADNFPIGDRYILTPGLPSFCDCKSGANKISYFTPKYNGVQFGISYTPDVQFFGTTSQTHAITKTTGDQFRDITALAAKYETEYKGVSIGLSAVGEVGKAKDSTVDRRDLKTYEVGAQFDYKGFSVAGSYNDRLHSGEPVVKLANAKYGGSSWTAGVAYNAGDWTTSLTYLNSKRANLFTNNVPATTAGHDLSYNTLEAVSFGIDCKLIEGFMPYAEYTIFDFKRGTAGVAQNYAKVLLVGSKIKF
jgi:hypothetical protein